MVFYKRAQTTKIKKMKEKIYPKGIITFPKRDGSPDFILGSFAVSINEFIAFCKENPELLSEYQGNKQLKCNILQGKNGAYFTVDTWKPGKEEPKETSFLDNSLPF